MNQAQDAEFRAGCKGKKAFAHHGQAEHRAKRMRQNHERDCFVEAYRCRHCGQWHVGQSRGGDVRRLKAKEGSK